MALNTPHDEAPSLARRAASKIADQIRQVASVGRGPRISAAARRGPADVIAAARRANVPANKVADAETLKIIKDRFKAASEAGVGSPEFQTLLDFWVTFPSDPRILAMCARVAAATAAPADQLAMWNAILDAFPGDQEALRMRLRWHMREKGAEEAREQLAAIVASPPNDFESDLFQVSLLRELREKDEIAEGYEGLIERHPSEEYAHLRYAQWLAEVGNLNQAALTLREGRRLAKTTRRLKKELDIVLSKLSAAPDLIALGGANASTGDFAIERILTDAKLVERRTGRQSTSFVGAVAMVTGSLGVGGAERQLAVTAKALQSAANEGRQINDYDIVGPVSVLCRSLRARQAGDFFHHELVEAGVEVHEYREFADYGGIARRSLVSGWRELLELAPPQMREGASRLTDYLRVHGPQVLHIWQDGSVFAAGLAAALAQVPRIILSVRTLPPIDRMERNKSEYPMLYRRMLALPGVRLSANSQFAAMRYAAWLDLAPEKVSVVYNGVDALPPAPRADSQTVFDRFDAASAPHSTTYGSVMRFDDNKRPLLWLDAAAVVLNNDPRARFILVGDGPLLAPAAKAAAQLGIAERVLFTGRRQDVGYWLSKMDAFMLLSRHEGLPNVLIEAQIAGVPVVATPAGGSAETVFPGGREFILGDAGAVTAQEAAAKLRALGQESVRRKLGPQAKSWASATFSVEQMLDSTIELYCA